MAVKDLSSSPERALKSLPRLYKKAVASSRALFWQSSVSREIASQVKNQNWTLAARSQTGDLVATRWVFTVEQIEYANGEIS